MKLYRIKFTDRLTENEYCSVLALDFMHACQVFKEECPNAEILACEEENCFAAVFYASGSYTLIRE